MICCQGIWSGWAIGCALSQVGYWLGSIYSCLFHVASQAGDLCSVGATDWDPWMIKAYFYLPSWNVHPQILGKLNSVGSLVYSLKELDSLVVPWECASLAFLMPLLTVCFVFVLQRCTLSVPLSPRILTKEYFVWEARVRDFYPTNLVTAAGSRFLTTATYGFLFKVSYTFPVSLHAGIFLIRKCYGRNQINYQVNDL